MSVCVCVGQCVCVCVCVQCSLCHLHIFINACHSPAAEVSVVLCMLLS